MSDINIPINEVNSSIEVAEELKTRIIDQLEYVIDPELGIDIVNLGLVYGIELNDEGHCLINLTLTTMGCPLADLITDEIHDVLKSIEEIKTTEVQLVWYPAWTTDRMTRYARIALGIR